MSATPRHRPTLKQSNKGFKSGKHSSKGHLKRTHAKDNATAASNPGAHRESVRQRLGGDAKVNRRNKLKQERENKKAAINADRRLGTRTGAPKIVALIPMTPSADANGARSALIAASADSDIPADQVGPLTTRFPLLKHRFTFLEVPRLPNAILHAAKVADIVVFVFSAVEDVDEAGVRTLSLVLSQGQPTVMGLVQGLYELKPKYQLQRRKEFQTWLKEKCAGDPKLFEADDADRMMAFLRSMSTVRPRPVHLRDNRPYMLVDGIEYSAETGQLNVSGYLRGGTISANKLVHFTEFGTYQVEHIYAAPDPRPLDEKREHRGGVEMGDADGETDRLLLSAEEGAVAPLSWERVPGPDEVDMADVGSDPGDVDDHKFVDLTKKVIRRRRVPRGTSEYQSEWYNALEGGEEEDDGGEDVARMEGAEPGSSDGEEEADMASVATGHTGADSDELMDEAEYDARHAHDDHGMEGEGAEDQAAMLAKMQSEDFQWPDEITLPPDGPRAKDIFREYRGLKSFNRSAWNPYENLPPEYSKIYALENFARTEQAVLDAAQVDGIHTGFYAKLTIAGVPPAFMERFDGRIPLVMFGLLEHENQLSVVHCAMTRHPTYLDPLESGSELFVHYGFRMLKACPILSGDNPRGDKHKYERFYQPGMQATATFYAPIHFGPCPVMFFRQTETGPVLVATGQLKSVDPTRLVVKRALLTGLPSKVHKKKCVVRKMFFNADDINYFKKVELTTKYGRHGHIRCALGTHGHYKAMFNGYVRSDDTICLALYTRVFPKWGTEELTCLTA